VSLRTLPRRPPSVDAVVGRCLRVRRAVLSRGMALSEPATRQREGLLAYLSAPPAPPRPNERMSKRVARRVVPEPVRGRPPGAALRLHLGSAASLKQAGSTSTSRVIPSTSHESSSVRCRFQTLQPKPSSTSMCSSTPRLRTGCGCSTNAFAYSVRAASLVWVCVAERSFGHSAISPTPDSAFRRPETCYAERTR
jgi:hypothetical protein